jgi:hypothetical protein
MNIKSYEIHARMPMTNQARNAGATGRTHWWAVVGTVNAATKKSACSKLRKLGEVPACADKLRAFSR